MSQAFHRLDLASCRCRFRTSTERAVQAQIRSADGRTPPRLCGGAMQRGAVQRFTASCSIAFANFYPRYRKAASTRSTSSMTITASRRHARATPPPRGGSRHDRSGSGARRLPIPRIETCESYRTCRREPLVGATLHVASAKSRGCVFPLTDCLRHALGELPRHATSAFTR